MRKIALRGCPVCGAVDSRGRRGCLCVECSLSRKTVRDTPQTIVHYDTVNEISEVNYNRRLSEGFAMMNGDY